MELNIEEIQNILPQRYPVLLIDKIIEYEKDKVEAVKNVSITEPYFIGHFVDEPVMPGIMIIEAMAQVATMLFYRNFQEKDKHKNIYYLTNVKSRFFKIVRPGDSLKLIATPVKLISNAGIVNVVVQCNDENVAKGEISFKVISR